MNLSEVLKQSNAFLRLGKAINIKKEYFHDCHTFSKFYMETNRNPKAYEYRMLLLIHGIEKGMCMATREFGESKVEELISFVDQYERVGHSEYSTAYDMSLSIIQEWCELSKKNGWSEDKCDFILRWLSQKNQREGIETGCIRVSKEDCQYHQSFRFDDFLQTRRSIREFSDKCISDKDIEECLELALMAPTACNRQMVGIKRVKDEKKRKFVLEKIQGISGFDKNNITLFLVTYDTCSLKSYAERNQGYFNAGLVAMTFAEALHSRGIGSCFLQWGNKTSETREIKRKLGIREDETIACALAAGYYPESTVIPMSYRKSIREIYEEL